MRVSRLPFSGALLAVLALAVGACARRDARPPRAANAVLFLSADVQGYLGPCGCSENMRGGIARAAGQVARARAAGDAVFFIDAGNGLFSQAVIPPDAVAQQERQARALADAFRAMGLSLRAPGPFDDARGPEFRASLRLPELAQGQLEWLEAGGSRVAVVSAADVKAADALASRARREGAVFAVALVPGSIDVALREAVGASSLDLVLAARPRDELAAEENRLGGGAVKVAQVQSKGRTLLRVDLSLRGDGRAEWVAGTGERDRELAALDERLELLRAEIDTPSLEPGLKALKQGKLEQLVARRQARADAPLPLPAGRNAATYRFVPLEPGLPEEPKVKAIEAAFDRDVGLLNVAWAQAHAEKCDPPDLDRAGYVGSQACVGCHLASAQVWAATKHVRAYASLEEKGKQFHLNCVTCHVTGWRKPGGVCRIDDVEGRSEVGCESCHGPGWKHTQLPVKQHIVRGREAKACVGCHDRENSPHFEFETYLKDIIGPGHGLPLPDAGVKP